MEHTNWWNRLTEDKRKEINRLHFTCELGKESDFDIHRAFFNLVIKQEQEHLFWWNSLSIERRDKLSQTYYNYESSHFLLEEQILYIHEKVNNHKTVVNVKEMYKGKVNKLPKLKGNEKFKQIRDDIRTTILGLCQLLIYQLDQLGEDKSIFSQGLKSAGKLLAKELEKNMNLYFRLNKEEQFTQADLLNLLCNSIEHNIKLAYRAAEMDEETCSLFLADYKELMNKYGIENDFLNETTKDEQH